MKTIIENVIKRGGYDLNDVINKIDTYHVEGRLTDEERAELYAMARKTPGATFDLSAELGHIWAKIEELEAAISAISGESEQPETEPETDTVPAWIQPTGAHDAYTYGERMRYTDGLIYESIYEGLNVWSPAVYPAGWKLIEE